MLSTSLHNLRRTGFGLLVAVAILSTVVTPVTAEDCDGDDMYTNDCQAGSADQHASDADIGSSGTTVDADAGDAYDTVASTVEDGAEEGVKMAGEVLTRSSSGANSKRTPKTGSPPE